MRLRVVLYIGLIVSSNFPNRASKTVLSRVAILDVISSVFFRFSSRTERAARDSSKSPAWGGARCWIDIQSKSPRKIHGTKDRG